MIRRNPTLIPLSDLEIQDVRDMHNEQKAEREKQEELPEQSQDVLSES